jgi:hypothetical protein
MRNMKVNIWRNVTVAKYPILTELAPQNASRTSAEMDGHSEWPGFIDACWHTGWP